MLLYLDYAAIICFVLFILMLIIRFHHIKRTGNYQNAGWLTVCFSWLLIIVFFISISGIAYGSARPAQFNQLTTKLASRVQPRAKHSQHHAASSTNQRSTKTTSSSKNEAPNVVWSPHNPKIADDDSVVRVRFLIPANTSVSVKGHLHHQSYGAVPADDQKQDVTLKFSDAGTYDVIMKHNGKTYTKQLEIN